MCCEPEDTPVRGNAMVSGDDEHDRAVENRIIYDLEVNQNPWAWCTVKVTAEWRGVEASAYLGCCSYKSREDFIEHNGGYIDELKGEALEELASLVFTMQIDG